jgi:hypothetical protein
MSTTIGDQTANAAEAVEHMPAEVLQSLAALAGAPKGVAELAFNAFPGGTQDWLITYGLAAEAEGQLRITDLGREAIEVAAARCPEPYADVAVGDLVESTRAGLEKLVAVSGIRLREPEAAAPTVTREDSTARRAGQRLAMLVSERVAHRHRAGSDNAHIREDVQHGDAAPHGEGQTRPLT